MPALEAWRKAQSHRHQFKPLPTKAGDVELEVCECGAVRPAQRPETD